MFKKIKKVIVEEDTLKKMSVYMIITSVIFLTIILLYCTYLCIIVKDTREDMNVYKLSKNSFVKGHEFKNIEIKDGPVYLYDMCKEECYYKVSLRDISYYTSIKKVDNNYHMEIYNIYFPISEFDMGPDISTLYVNYYKDTLIYDYDCTDLTGTHDLGIVFNGGQADMFYSMGINEIEYTNEGIVYYEYACSFKHNGEATRFKYRRTPYNFVKTLLSSETITDSRCK